ncbi:MAG: NAD-dependent epimerase/dehydratase family protein [Planctomycetota bacterium]|nr:MAG: NAD-dependent epimerase/dehydratase family protein [Planctomycetota bacterium]
MRAARGRSSAGGPRPRSSAWSRSWSRRISSGCAAATWSERRGGGAVRVFVTGIGGFVGRHLARELLARGAVLGGLVHAPTPHEARALAALPGEVERFEGDLLDRPALEAALRRFRPTHVAHLAGFSSAGRSFAEPLRCFEVNALGTLTLLEALRRLGSAPRLLVLSSAEVYGGAEHALDESAPCAPRSPYAASKASCELALRAQPYCDGLPWIVARSFGHIGPGQRPGFVTPNFARQIAEAEARGQACRLAVGDLRAVRDFSDIRDAARAYAALLLHAPARRVYNVGSGRGLEVRRVLEVLVEAAGVPVTVEHDPTRLRPGDPPPPLVADTHRLCATIGFCPRPAVPQAVRAVLEEQRQAVRRRGAQAPDFARAPAPGADPARNERGA